MYLQKFQKINLRTYIKYILFASMMTVNASHSLASSCLSSYGANNYESNYANKTEEPISLLNQVIQNLSSNSNGFPILIVSETIESFLKTIFEKYNEMTDKISEKKELNGISFSVSKAELTINTFYNLHRNLETELAKTRRNEEKIKDLSDQMKKCLANISICQSNIKDSMIETKKDILETNEFIQNLQLKANELKDLKNWLPESIRLDELVMTPLLELIDTYIQNIENIFPHILESHLKAQSTLMAMAESQIPSLLKTKSMAAGLEAEWLVELGALRLKRDSTNDNETSGKKSTLIEMKSELAQRFERQIKESELSPFGRQIISDLNNKRLVDVFIDAVNRRQSDQNTFDRSESVYLTAKDLEQITFRMLYQKGPGRLFERENFLLFKRTNGHWVSDLVPYVDIGTKRFSLDFYLLFLLSRNLNKFNFDSMNAWFKEIMEKYLYDRESEIKKYGIKTFFSGLAIGAEAKNINQIKTAIRDSKIILEILSKPIHSTVLNELKGEALILTGWDTRKLTPTEFFIHSPR
ncbi:MAG: hypothetical protein J0M15_08805 [Deltaproteobacteria bacterium]|nr:hypothetical protein [Deltaproteobacteria bacterium]